MEQTQAIDGPFTRTASPAILEHRILKLKQQLKAEVEDHQRTVDKHIAALKRIQEFESLCSTFAEKIDAIEAQFILITGKGFQEYLMSLKAKREK